MIGLVIFLTYAYIHLICYTDVIFYNWQHRSLHIRLIREFHERILFKVQHYPFQVAMNLNIKSSCPSTCVWSGDIKWMEFQSPNSSLLRLGSNIQKRECMYTHSHTHTNTLKVCKSPNIQLQRSHVWNLRSSHTGRVQKPTEDVGAECPSHTFTYLCGYWPRSHSLSLGLCECQ